jgi:hypothetical protein
MIEEAENADKSMAPAVVSITSRLTAALSGIPTKGKGPLPRVFLLDETRRMGAGKMGGDAKRHSVLL